MKKLMGIIIICIGACFIAVGIIMICSNSNQVTSYEPTFPDVEVSSQSVIAQKIEIEPPQEFNDSIKESLVQNSEKEISELKESSISPTPSEKLTPKEKGDQYEDFVANLLASPPALRLL